MNRVRFGGRTVIHRHRKPILLQDGRLVYSCGHEYDAEKAEAGRRANRRGRTIQRKQIEGLGGHNLPGNAPNLDGVGSMFHYESKSGSAFPERAWRWLKGIPHGSGEIPVLIITDTPGSGKKARSVVIVEYRDWRDLHGE